MLRASIARSALNFWTKLTVALSRTIAKMTVASVTSPNAYARAAAAINIMTIRSMNSSRNWSIQDFLAFVWIILGPSWERFFWACWCVSPTGAELNSVKILSRRFLCMGGGVEFSSRMNDFFRLRIVLSGIKPCYLNFFLCHSFIFLWWPDVRISGTSWPMKVAGRVYCGYSFLPLSAFEKLSSSGDSSSPRTPGIRRARQSITTIAGSSPPVRTYLPVDHSSSMKLSRRR